MPAVEMLHEMDPRAAILEKVGNLDGIQIFGNDVLTAIYKRPQKTASGIILTDATRGEDVYQGKVFLVLKLGPMAFVDDENFRFKPEERFSAGDWAVARPSDGWTCTLNTLRRVGVSKDNLVELRIFKDISLKMRIEHPDVIY